MGYKINFADGDYINILASSDIVAYDTIALANSVLMLSLGTNGVIKKWVGEKEDLDGNKWIISEFGNTLTIKDCNDAVLFNLVLQSNVYGGVALFYIPEDDPNAFFIGYYGRQDRIIYVNSNDGTYINYGQAVAEYPEDMKYNFLSSLSMAVYCGRFYRIAGLGGYHLGLSHFTNSAESTDPEISPYDPAGTTGTGGGHGNFDTDSEAVDFPSLPTLSAVDTGFITLFNPSIAQLNALANYMWSNPLFDLDAWKKIFANPMDAILGLSIVPVNVPSGSVSAVTVGNISTGVNMTKASQQYVEVDCGSLTVKEFWGAYLDYAPYTKCEIHLPYCGIHPLDIDDVMGKTIHVKYHVDVLSGACCAYVKCGESVLYTFVGQCSSSIPITGDDWTSVINGVMSVAASIGSMVATGGLSAPVTAANAAGMVGQAVVADANIGSTVTSMKPAIEKSGAIGGTGGMLAIQKPYLIITRPKQALPLSQNKYTGYPSFITVSLATVSGYTEVEHIHLENIPATGSELTEIEALLKGGVIF